ncbi:hypothetical protein ACIPSE_46385, partial [Streptomyces sp. NPDC090106]|uniref:hypothetical protein n=1 Tax=Streptomyces sp. NPDC090106 TaxID=3365946 RepID=UPI0037F5AF92
NVGEAGVCGFAAAGLVRVAILEKGRSSNEDPGKLNEDATKRELERLNKQISENPASAVRRLKEAASQTRGVNL